MLLKKMILEKKKQNHEKSLPTTFFKTNVVTSIQQQDY